MSLFAVVGFGLLVGSFTNVLIARVPGGEDWVRGSSRCPKCEHDIAWYDNVPVVSWLWLRRKCRHCGEPISGRYPLVELTVMTLFVGVYTVWGLSLLALALAYLAVVSTALVFIDLEVQRLPNALVLPSFAVVGLLLVADAAVEQAGQDLVRAAIGLVALGGFYGLMWFIYPAGMGFGDVKTAGLLGMTAGYLGYTELGVGAFFGPILGGAVALAGLALRKMTMKSKVPYGPALIIGAWIGYFAGPAIGDIYLKLFI